MSDTKQLTLPITGMTCANCVATVERNLKKLDGVQSAVVNLSSERATVEFEPAKLQLNDMIARVEPRGLWRRHRRGRSDHQVAFR